MKTRENSYHRRCGIIIRTHFIKCNDSPYMEIDSKWAIDINVCAKVIKFIKFLEENTGVHIYDFGAGNILNITKNRGNKKKKKTDKWDSIKIKKTFELQTMPSQVCKENILSRRTYLQIML